MENCLFYKYVYKSFKRQIILFLSIMILSFVSLFFFKINLGIIFFFSLFVTFAFLILVSSLRGKSENLKNLNTLLSQRNFDEVVIESSDNEILTSKKKIFRNMPYLLFFKLKGKVIFQTMFNFNDFNEILILVKNLIDNKNVKFSRVLEKQREENQQGFILPDLA